MCLQFSQNRFFSHDYRHCYFIHLSLTNPAYFKKTHLTGHSFFPIFICTSLLAFYYNLSGDTTCMLNNRCQLKWHIWSQRGQKLKRVNMLSLYCLACWIRPWWCAAEGLLCSSPTLVFIVLVFIVDLLILRSFLEKENRKMLSWWKLNQQINKIMVLLLYL